MKSSSLLEKKPQLLLMKWNSFLEKYHHIKQLNDINSSVSLGWAHLKFQRQEAIIYDVPYIESEQISINERSEENSLIIDVSPTIGNESEFNGT